MQSSSAADRLCCWKVQPRSATMLSADYFDSQRVPDSKLRDLHSVLTVVDGKVIFEAMR